MSVTCGFYNSLNHDRKYDATQMSSIFDGIIRDGIFMSIGTHLSVTAGEGMFVTVGEGKAWFNHTWTLNDAELPLAIDVAELVLDRIDAVVLEVDSSESVRNNTIKVIKGTPSSEPERPAMEDTETLHQYPLAYIYVKANATQITTSDITNMIGTENTPFITGILETINIDGLIAQWKSQWNDQIDANQREYDAWLLVQQTSFLTWREDEESTFEAWRIENQAEFEEWFQNLQNQLDENQATNLQNQINDIKEDLKVTGGSRVVVTIDDKKGTIKVAGLTVTLRIDGAEYTSVVEENKTATFAGILEIGVAEIECNDSTQEFTTGCTLEIPCYSYYEATTVKVDMYEQWLLTAGYTLDDYPEVSDIVNDYEAMYRMMNLHATVDYWVRWYNANNTILSHFTTSEVSMKAIGENDYAADSLMAIPAVNDALLGSDYWEYVFKALVPTMTSNTSPEGEAFASVVNSVTYDAYKAFDGINDTYKDCWVSDECVPSVSSPEFIGYKSSVPLIVKNVIVSNRNSVGDGAGDAALYPPKDVIVQGSNDGTKWDNLASYTNTDSTSAGSWAIPVSSNTAYTYHRLLITSAHDTGYSGKWVSVGELQFYGRQLKGLLVPMTDYSNDIGTVSGSSEHTNSDARAYFGIDTNENEYYWYESADGRPNIGGYLQFMFNKPTLIDVIRYRFGNSSGSGSFTIKAKLQYTLNGNDWLDVENSEKEYIGFGVSDRMFVGCDLTNVLGIRIINTYKNNLINFGASDLQVYAPNYEETVKPFVPGGFKNWLEAGGLNPDSYADMDELLEDEAAVRTLMTKKAAVDVLAKMSGDELATIINHRYAAKWINYREYAYSTLSAKSEIKALMDASGMYGMYITAESKCRPLVPTLTSDNGSDGGTVIESDHYMIYYGRYAFDNNSSTYWLPNIGKANAYIGYKFSVPTICGKVTASIEKQGSPTSESLYIQGSNNGTTWENISEELTIDKTAEYSWKINNTIPYMYYRLYFTGTIVQNGGVAYVFKTLQFYGYQLEALIPPMTSNTSDVGNCIGDISISSNPMYYAFDNNVNTECYRESVGPNGRLGYCFNSTKKVLCAKILNTYRYTAKLQYSDDGISWNDASSSVASIENADVYIVSTETNEHEYWSIEYSNNEDSQFYTKEIQFYGEPTLWQPKGLVPVMTGNTTPYGTVIYDSIYDSGYEGYKAFDNVNGSWASSGLAAIGKYIGYIFTSPTCVNRLYVSATSIAKFKLQGSNDNGTTWQDVGEEISTGVSSGSASCNLNVDNDKYYVGYRLYVTDIGTSTNSINISSLQFYGRQLEALIPPMTSNTTPMGEVIYSSEYSSTDNPGWKAFDGKQETGWLPKTGTKEDYVGYKFQSPVRANMMYLCYGSASYAFDQTQPFVKVQASNDNSEWIDLSSQIGLDVSKYDAGGHLYVDFDNDQEYLYYRASFNPTICVTNSSTDFIAIHTLQFYGAPDYDSRTYIYDHGVEVMELVGYKNTTSYVAEKQTDRLYLKKTGSGSAAFTTVNKIDMTNYSLMRASLDTDILDLVNCHIANSDISPWVYAHSMSAGGGCKIINTYDGANLDETNVNNEVYALMLVESGGSYNETLTFNQWWLE